MLHGLLPISRLHGRLKNTPRFIQNGFAHQHRSLGSIDADDADFIAASRQLVPNLANAMISAIEHIGVLEAEEARADDLQRAITGITLINQSLSDENRDLRSRLRALEENLGTGER